MNGIDNIAGYTLTVGTADFVITDSIAQYDPIVDNLADGDERNYKAQFIDPSFGDDYETGRGTWNAGAGTISRTTIKTSSNNGSIVNFGAGPKVVFIVSDYESLTDMNNMVDSAVGAGSLKMTTAERTNIAANVALLATRGDAFTYDIGTAAGTVAEGDDARFGSVDIGDLTPATSIDGTELLPADQGGDGVSITAQQVSGTPVTDATSLAFARVRGYSRFDRTRNAFSGTDAALCDLEPYTCFKAAGGAVAQFAAFGTAPPSLVLNTGTATNEYACIRHSLYPTFFDPTLEYIDIFSFAITALPSTEAYTLQTGFIVGAPALATQGMYLQLSAADAQFQCVVKDAGGETLVDTGITAAIAPAKYVRKIHYDPVALSTKFYLDGVLVGTIANSTRVVATNQLLGMAASIRKSAGTTAASLITDGHYYDLDPYEGTPLEYFS